MKQFITYQLFLFLITFSYAQLDAPVASPRAKISQKIGLVDVNLEYSRPSKKGRVIFGELVPFGKIWRTGANNATMISFSGDVKINNEFLEKGEYHIYSVPSENTLDLIIYSQTNAWGSLSEFDESLIKLRVSAEFQNMNTTTETFTISFENISNNGANMSVKWDNKSAIYSIDALTKDKMLANINNVLSGSPTANDYRKAAVYYYEENIDIKKAIEWINIAFNDSDDLKYWQLMYKALIHEKAGKMKKARQYAKKGLDKAKSNNTPDGINALGIIFKRLNEK